MTYAKLCPCCGEIKVVGQFEGEMVDKIDNYLLRRASRKAGRIQDELPELTAAQREQILTGTCPECWDDMFGEQEV